MPASVPACITCPGETSRSTTSPPIGASTGICAEMAHFVRSSGFLMPRIFMPCSAAFRSACACVRSDSACCKIALGDGVVIVQILGSRVIFVRQAERVARLQIGVQQLRIIRAAYFQHGLPFVSLAAPAPPEFG